jgi:hypothetical protein
MAATAKSLINRICELRSEFSCKSSLDHTAQQAQPCFLPSSG